MPATASNGRFLCGWDYAQLTSSSTQDAVGNYFVTLPGQASSSPYGPYTLTATLVWNRQAFQSQINNLDLSLYDVTTQSLVSISDSTVDNVQELYVSGLNPGNVYSMQVRNWAVRSSAIRKPMLSPTTSLPSTAISSSATPMGTAPLTAPT